MPGTDTGPATPFDPKDAAQAAYYEAQKSFKRGLYQHYKTSGFYIVFALTVDEATLAPLVHYYSIEKKSRWTRTFAVFTELMTSPEAPTAQPRFQYVRYATWQELALAAGFDALIEGLMHLAQAHHFVTGVLIQPQKHEADTG